MTERFAVIGDPIAHSLSPTMHTAAFKAAGIDAVYEAHRVVPDMLGRHVHHLRSGYSGFNVTIPHKEALFTELDEIHGAARELGAVNTVVIRNGVLSGWNTDPAGFTASLSTAGFDARGSHAFVFGAGGGARAVVHALVRLGASIDLANRHIDRAHSLARSFRSHIRVVADGDVLDALAGAELVVNCTPLGMSHVPNLSPLPLGATLSPDALAFDLVYGRRTPFLREADQQGCRTLDGLEMLVQQGAESFRLWTGAEPDVDIMRQSCLHLLEERACSAS